MKGHTGILFFVMCAIIDICGAADPEVYMTKEQMDAINQRQEVRPELRATTRTSFVFISGMDLATGKDDEGSVGWGHPSACADTASGELTWVTQIDRLTIGDYLFYIAMACNPIGFRGLSSFIESTLGEPVFTWNTNYAKQWSVHCTNSFVIGVSLETLTLNDTKYPGRIVHTNYLCAGDNWYYPRENDVGTTPPVPIPHQDQMICPYLTAVCGMQTKLNTSAVTGKKYVTNLRIYCCYGDLSKSEQFIRKGGPPLQLRKVGVVANIVS